MEEESILGYHIFIVSEHDDGEQVRKHKKRRINKKWLKRYGTHHAPLKPGEIAIVSSRILLMTRPTYRRIKKALAKRETAAAQQPSSQIGDYYYYQPPKGRRCGTCTLVGMCQLCPENRVWRKP